VSGGQAKTVASEARVLHLAFEGLYEGARQWAEAERGAAPGGLPEQLAWASASPRELLVYLRRWRSGGG